MLRVAVPYACHRDLFGQCIFTTIIPTDLSLSEELYAATLTPQFAANALALQPSRVALGLDVFEEQYFAATDAGACCLTCAYHAQT